MEQDDREHTTDFPHCPGVSRTGCSKVWLFYCVGKTGLACWVYRYVAAMGWQSSVLGVGRACFSSGSSERFSEVNVGSTLVNYMCFQVSMLRNMEAWCCAGQQNLQLPLYLQVGFLANRQPGWALAVSGTGSSVSKS